jgi:hypothetical protein
MAAGPRTRADSRVPQRVVTGPHEVSAADPAVFGFRVNTKLPLQFLRRGGGEQPLEVVEADDVGEGASGELLGEWPLQGTEYPTFAKLCRTPDGYEYWTSDAGLFRVDITRGRITVPRSTDALLLEQRLHGMPMILSFLARGDVSLHAAAVEIDNAAFILAAPSRYGKTTLAFAFQQARHRVLSEDLICCRPEAGEAIPGPALLRLRPDVFDGVLPAGLHVVARRPDRVFLGFDEAARGSAAPVPIKAIVFLRQGAEIAVEPVPAQTALKDLWRLSFRTGTEDGRADSFRSLSRLAGSIPCWNVARPMTAGSLKPTIEIIESL